jgi:hypothetical protein
VQKAVAALVQTQNILDADRGTAIAWAVAGKQALVAKAAQKARQPTVSK